MNALHCSWEKLHIPLLRRHIGLWLVVTGFNYAFTAVVDDFGNLVFVPS